MKKISVVINYCSNEQIFIESLLKECSKFSDDIVVSYGSHLYNGIPENTQHILEYQKKYENCKFIEYKVDMSLNLSKQRGVNKRPIAYWHNLARWTGINSLKYKEWVFIIDCDEIPEGSKVAEFLSLYLLDEKECYKFANYWYFKSPDNQALSIEDSVLLIHYKYLNEENIFGDYERDHLIPSSGTILRREIKGIDNKPMFHHFSWVRTRDGLKNKISSWAHSNDIFKDINVEEFINFIYKDDNVNDIVHNYKYKKVPNIFNILI